MKRIAITGSSGFIGTNLINYARAIYADDFEIVEVPDNIFADAKKFSAVIQGADILIHLAGAQRSKKDDIYETNIVLTNKLIDALETNKTWPHVIFMSSIHEVRGDGYGKSKKESRELLSKICKKNNASFTGIMSPNVFGPFSRPLYNSVVATFCHQLATKKKPKIEEDAEIDLVYVGNLIEVIFKAAKNNKTNEKLDVSLDVKIKVSQILDKLTQYRDGYLDDNIIPELKDSFEVNLFNTFRSFIPDEQRLRFLEVKKDDRGYLCEALKTNTKGQVFYSKTNKGVARGNHFHSRKIERFCVLEGKAEIAIRRVGGEKITKFKINGSSPAIIDMPIWYTHNIKNISSKPLFAMFWANEIFNKKDQDTYYEQV